MKYIIIILTAISAINLNAQTHQIGHTTINFTDPARNNRTIQTEIYYPANVAGNDVAAAQGNFPVIIFGHGFVMIYSAYQNLWEQFVPRGYIMAFPRTEGNISPSHDAFGKDLAFLVAAMQAEGAKPSSKIYNAVLNKTALMGHSMGGGCSILAAANNTSVETVIAFAAAETNPSAKAAAKNVTIPALIFSGEKDGVAPPIDHQIPIYDSLSSSCKYYINIKGGAHCYFANSNMNCDFGENSSSSGISITRAQQQQTTYDFVNPWLDYKLKGDCNKFFVFQDSINNSSRITHQQNCNLNIQAPVISENGGVLTSTIAGSYQWYFNGNVINGATAQNYTITLGQGDYHVEVVYPNGCVMSSLPFTLNCSTFKPVITNNGDTLISSTGNSYQWYLNSTVISGATSQTYIPGAAYGNYTVIVNYNNGCTEESASYSFGCSLPAPAINANNETLSTNSADSYQWYFNGNIISGATAQSYQISMGAGNYSVEITVSGCSATSLAYSFNCNAYLPSIADSSGYLVTGNTGVSYQWYYNNVLISGANSSLYFPAEGSGNYSVNVVFSNGCDVTSSAYSYTCSIAQPVLTDSSGVLYSSAADSYQWYFNNSPIVGAVNQSYFPNLGEGNYSVQITISNCTSISNNYFLDCSSFTPEIIDSGGTLYSSIAETYQWYLNGMAISGAVFQEYMPLQSGNYSVEVTYMNGCKKESTPYSFVYTSLYIQSIAQTIDVYPNPATDYLIVNPSFGKEIKIFSMDGRLILMQKMHSSVIDISFVSEGVYILQISEGEIISTKRFIKQ